MEEFIKTADYNHPCIVYRMYEFPKDLRNIMDKYNQYNFEVELEGLDKYVSYITEDTENNKEYIITVKIEDLNEFYPETDVKMTQVNLFEITDNDFTDYKNLFKSTRTFVNCSESYILKIVLNSGLIHEMIDILRVRNPEIDFNYFKDHFKVVSGNENHGVKFLNELNRFAEFITEIIEN